MTEVWENSPEAESARATAIAQQEDWVCDATSNAITIGRANGLVSALLVLRGHFGNDVIAARKMPVLLADPLPDGNRMISAWVAERP